MDSEEQIILILCLGIPISAGAIKVWASLKHDVPIFVASLIPSSKNWYIYLAILLPIFIFLNYKLHKKIFENQRKKKEEQEKLENKEKELDETLKIDIEYCNLEQIEDAIEKINRGISSAYEFHLEDYISSLESKLEDAKKRKKILEHRKEVEETREEKERVTRELEERTNELDRIEREAEHRKLEILRRLNTEEKLVFLKSDLTETEHKVLLQNSYNQINEYSIIDKLPITVLVRKPENFNHSLTHVFLVWDVKRLLKQKGIKQIEEHLTRDADLTFNYQEKTFALEIETGTSLEHKRKLGEKVNYLNNKYPKRWFFIVSNKEIVYEYRKFGFATTRKGVGEFIENMLKFSTRN